MAQAVMIAKCKAREMNFPIETYKLLVVEAEKNSRCIWRVNFVPPRPANGRFQRGGGYLIEVDAENSEVISALRTQ